MSKNKPSANIGDREIPEDDSNYLHAALGLQAGEPLPEKLEEKYWEFKLIADRSNDRITQHTVNLMCWMLGFGAPNAKELAPPTVLDMYRKKQVKLGSDVEVCWRDKWMPGVLKDVTGSNELVVQPVGEADERRFTADKVRLPAVAA